MKRLISLVVAGAALTVGAFASAAPTAMGIKPEAGIGLPRDISLEGHRIDSLLFSTSVLVTILFVIMVVWMLWALLAHREGKHKAEYDQGDGKKNVTTAIAISSVVFLVVDGNLFVNSMVDITEAFWNFPKSEETVKIEINARQWVWGARYAGADGEWNTQDDVVTNNDVRVPVDTPVMFQMGAVDVIHSFYLPNLRIKQDAVPGNITRMWFQATETGQFEIACAQHCGVHHYKMRGVLTVYSKPEYDAWVAQQSAVAARSFDPEDRDAQWGWAWEEQ